MTAGPLTGLRVVEYAQYVAGPLCGVLLADLGADVIKVEPPGGDGYRHVLPVAPGVGRYFLPLNRGKRSVVLDLKSEEGQAASARLLGSADVVLHNHPPERARRFGLDWRSMHASYPRLVAGVVSSFGAAGPLVGAPAYDLVAQARSGLLTAHASPGDRVPVRSGGIPMADLAAGFLLAAAVLAALVRARETGVGELAEVSLLAAALAVQLQDLVHLPGEPEPDEARAATRGDLAARAAEIAGGVATNPYYRCYETVDGLLAVACLNLPQRQAFLALFGEDDPTIDAPDLVPADRALLAAKKALTSRIERHVTSEPTDVWTRRLEQAGVPCAVVLSRDTVLADQQVVAAGLAAEVEQPGLGPVRLLGPFIRSGGAARPAPELGADTRAVLAELE